MGTTKGIVNRFHSENEVFEEGLGIVPALDSINDLQFDNVMSEDGLGITTTLVIMKFGRMFEGSYSCENESSSSNNKVSINLAKFSKVSNNWICSNHCCGWVTGICQNWNLSELIFILYWNLSELEIVRIGICQNLNLSESEFVRIGICQNWNL